MTPSEEESLTLLPDSVLGRLKRESVKELGDQSKSVKIGNHNFHRRGHLFYRQNMHKDQPEEADLRPQTFRKAVLALMHDQNGHYDSARTHDAVRKHFYWPRYLLETKKYVKNCRRCQATAMRCVGETGWKSGLTHALGT